jgi:hypothetical protein
MLLLRSCPRCHGDLAVDCDRRAAFLYCVQCGHTLTLAQERALGIRATRRGLIHTSAPAHQAGEKLEPAGAAR